MSKHWSEALADLNACGDAILWARTQKTLAEAWRNCPRGDWMLWLAAKTMPREAVVLAACDCAEWGVARFVERGDHMLACLLTLHVAREWAAGREDIETVRAAAYAYAADAAAYAAYAACAASAAYAAYAAAHAADAADAADAAHAADAAADAAASAASARSLALAELADLVRARLPCPVLSPAVAA